MPELDLGSVIGPQGPKGDPGNQGTVGPRGPQGEQGDAGKDATINGVNALQISVGQGLKESQEGGTYSIAMGDEDYKNLQNAKGAVRFDQAQALTPAQQEQAQHNIGTTWPCNPNLLDNYCFQIWQQYPNGSYSGVPNGSYVPDRWIITSSNGHIISNLIKATSYGGIKNSNGPNCRITQRLENAAQYNGMTLTLSVLKNTGLHTFTKVVSGWADTTDIFAGFSAATAWLNAGETIIAVKLEIGPTQTLAHREGDKWVLNEIPDYGEQLRRCQRYFVRLGFADQYCTVGLGLARDGNYISIPLTVPEDLRTLPAVTISGQITMRHSDKVVTGSSTVYVDANGVGSVLLKIQASGLTAGDLWEVFLAPGNYLSISADL